MTKHVRFNTLWARHREDRLRQALVIVRLMGGALRTTTERTSSLGLGSKMKLLGSELTRRTKARRSLCSPIFAATSLEYKLFLKSVYLQRIIKDLYFCAHRHHSFLS
jgi:hypothetical protein